MKENPCEEILSKSKLAEIAYGAYVRQIGGVFPYSKEPFPTWDRLGSLIQACWVEAALSVLAAKDAVENALPGRYSTSCVGIVPDSSGAGNHSVVHTHLIIDANNEEVAMRVAAQLAKEAHPTAIIGSSRAIRLPK